MSTYNTIYQIVRQIPKGKVATYGQVADLANLYGKARQVGYALYRVDTGSSDVPWHRVINAKGEISYSSSRHGADYLQRSLLEQEGIRFSPEGKINLREYLKAALCSTLVVFYRIALINVYLLIFTTSTEQ